MGQNVFHNWKFWQRYALSEVWAINGRAAQTTKREWSTESQASCFTTKDMIIPSSKFNETIWPDYLIRLRWEPGPDSRISQAIAAVK